MRSGCLVWRGGLPFELRWNGKSEKAQEGLAVGTVTVSE